jgi:YihY family inner membrane protein
MASTSASSNTGRFFAEIGRLIRDKNVFYSASALSFNIFICSIPLSLLALSVVGFVLSPEEASALLIMLASEFFPKTFSDTAWLETMINPLTQRSGILGLVGLGIMVVTSQGVFNIAKLTVFDILDITDRRHPFLELLQNFVTIGVLGALLLSFSLTFTVLSVFLSQSVYIPIVGVKVDVAVWYEVVTQSLSVGFTLLLFFLLFRYLSEKRIGKRSALAGAITYTIMFEVSKWAFSAYVGFALVRYENLYQGYTFVIVTGFWAFYSAVMFVISTMVTRAFQETFFAPIQNGYSDQAH